MAYYIGIFSPVVNVLNGVFILLNYTIDRISYLNCTVLNMLCYERLITYPINETYC